MLTWNLQNVFSGLYLHAIFLFGSVCVVYSDCTPEQLAAIMNCSRHERHTRNYDYMEGGDVRIRQLFSGTQWFLTIDDNGIINGTQDPTNCYSKDKSFCLIKYQHLNKSSSASSLFSRIYSSNCELTWMEESKLDLVRSFWVWTVGLSKWQKHVGVVDICRSTSCSQVMCL